MGVDDSLDNKAKLLLLSFTKHYESKVARKLLEIAS
jgi:hypothetical protein